VNGREICEGLQSAEGEVEREEEEEKEHAKEGREEAVEEVGRGEAVVGSWGGEEGEEALLHGVVDKANGYESNEEHDGGDEPADDVSFFQEPGDKAVAVGSGFKVGLAGVGAERSLSFEIGPRLISVLFFKCGGFTVTLL